MVLEHSFKNYINELFLMCVDLTVLTYELFSSLVFLGVVKTYYHSSAVGCHGESTWSTDGKECKCCRTRTSATGPEGCSGPGLVLYSNFDPETIPKSVYKI